MKSKKRIFFVHLLNDYSGSPLVLSQVIKIMAKDGNDCHVFTNQVSQGYLGAIEGVRYHIFFYHWSRVKALTLLYLFISQTLLFFYIIYHYKKGTILYVNTVLPFGGAIAGKLLGARVIYHIHETSLKPKILKHFLFGLANSTASDAVYVSRFLFQKERLFLPINHVVYNSLSNDFLQKSLQIKSLGKPTVFQVLMLCSLKTYKGVWDFVELSYQMPTICFNLVLNASQKEMASFFGQTTLPQNLRLVTAQKDVHPFYAESHLLLNLSHPDKWQETFGMTVIEAMAYGIPAIVPPVGGIAELIVDDFNGFKIAHHAKEELKAAILKCATQEIFYKNLAYNASQKVYDFSESIFSQRIKDLFD